MKTAEECIDEVTAIATSSGNADYDSYMHGMANGLILAQAIIRNNDPEFLDAPDVWLADIPDGDVGFTEVGSE